MIDFDDIIAEKVAECSLDDWRRILAIDELRTEQASALLNFLIKNQDISKACISVKGPYETIYQYVIISR